MSKPGGNRRRSLRRALFWALVYAVTRGPEWTERDQQAYEIDVIWHRRGTP
ncbi:MAG TPA: hypothetical protein VHX38_02395 [Pseudonocardiaceae bacterium]|jgi:hypothetical protein|nr:hypothetical protein [Pseudonocardiaceae bacterium]